MSSIGWVFSEEGMAKVLRPTPETLVGLVAYGVEEVRFFVQRPTMLNCYYFQGRFDLGVGIRSYNLSLQELRGGKEICGDVHCIEGSVTQSTTHAEDRAGFMLAQQLVATLQPDAFSFIIGESWPGSSEQLKKYWDQVAEWQKLPKLGQPVTYDDALRIAALTSAEAEREVSYLCWQGEQAGSVMQECLDALREVLELAYAHPDRYQRLPNLRSVGIGPARPLPYHGD